MEPIGGYFSLELPYYEEYHKDAIRLNTGRNCLEYILHARKYCKVYLPFFTCEVILEPFKKLNVAYEFYHINMHLELDQEIILNAGEALLYTNYFGLKQEYVERLTAQYGKRLIVDNTQAFYSKPIGGVDAFYTCRKFFGVPDGAYLYTDAKLDFDIEQDVSYDRMSFLLKRHDVGAEAGYRDFQELSRKLVGQPIKLMSNLTKRMMQGINYQAIAQRRRNNYHYLYMHLSGTNLLQLPMADDSVPMVYPYLSENKTLKERLIAEKIFVATYWPNVFEWCSQNEWEYLLAKRAVFIPIDQRNDESCMHHILEVIDY